MKRLIELSGGLLVAGALLVLPMVADAAVLSIFPERSSIFSGETVRLEVGIDTEGERVNTVQAMLIIPEGLSVVAVETGGSIIDLWVDVPELDETTGAVQIAGAMTGGFAGRGLIASVVLFAEQRGSLDVLFDPNSFVLLHDGAGTSAPTIREGTRIEIGDAATFAVRSNTHPEGVWSASTDALIEWDAEEDARYSWTFDSFPGSIPDTEAEEIGSALLFEGLGDGMHYFHLREGVLDSAGEYAWSDPIHYRILVDTVAPKPYEPIAIDDGRVIVPARDESAGISSVAYRWKSELLLRGGWRTIAQNDPITIPTPLQWFGGELIIRAVDGAGNAREKTVEVEGSGVAQGAALAVVVVLLIIILRSIRRVRRR
jgi:hypothetical protein